MVTASGTWYMSRTKPLATFAADGTFALTLLVFDRIDSHIVEPWRITWSGEDALGWWCDNEGELPPGQPIYANLKHIRTFSAVPGRTGSEHLARVILMYLSPVVSRPQPRDSGKVHASSEFSPVFSTSPTSGVNQQWPESP